MRPITSRPGVRILLPLIYKKRVAGLLEVVTCFAHRKSAGFESRAIHLCGRSSMVEPYPSKVAVARSNRVVRSIFLMNWYVYLVRCNDNSLYCGISNDVDRRVQKHNSGKGARYTKYKGPVQLVYKKFAGSKSEALKQEIRIKRLSKKRKEELCHFSSAGRASD